MRRRLPLLCLFLSVILAACASQKQDDNPPILYPYQQELPLNVGDSWVYRVTRYDGFNSDDIMTATFLMTDTISSVEVKDAFFIATVQSVQSAEVPIEIRGSYPMTDALRSATTKNYWLIVDGNRVLRQEDNLNLSDLQSRVQVELAFPVDLSSQWSIYNATAAPLNRTVARVDSIIVPAGAFTNCRYLDTNIAGMTIGDWFCPGVGLVQHYAEHQGTPYGNRQELISYKVR